MQSLHEIAGCMSEVVGCAMFGVCVLLLLTHYLLMHRATTDPVCGPQLIHQYEVTTNTAATAAPQCCRRIIFRNTAPQCLHGVRADRQRQCTSF